MIKLKKEFDNFYDNIKISSETNMLIEKRQMLQADFKENFPSECEKVGIAVNKSDMRFIDQGSYSLHTTITNKDGIVDRDVAVIFPLDVTENDDPRILKKCARDALKIENSREPVIKEPCITVGYHKNGEEFLHIDFPLYAEHGDGLYLARGKEFSDNYEWEPTDPEGLNKYFCDKLKENSQLRRIIRYLKKWKQEKYRNAASDHQIPPSIGLTLLACEKFVVKKEDYVDDDLKALQHVFEEIENCFVCVYDGNGNVTDANITVTLPTKPYTDVFYKLKKSRDAELEFYKKVHSAASALSDAVNLEAEHDAALSVQNVLGDEFEIPEKVAVVKTTANRKEHSFG